MQEEQAAHTSTLQHDFLANIMRGDKLIWGIYIALFSISAVEIFSASSQLAYKSDSVADPAVSHIRNLLLGLLGLLLTQNMSIRSMKAWGKMFWIAAMLLSVLTLFFGVEQKGAARSIMGLQPVEFSKLGIVMLLCWAITLRDASYHSFSAVFRTSTRRRRYWFYCLIILLPTLTLFTQNLSSALIIAIASLGIMFLGRVYGLYLWRTVFVSIFLALLGMSALKALSERDQGIDGLQNIDEQPTITIIDRATTWASRIFEDSGKPLWEEDINGKSSQKIYAHMALVNGYPFGQFIGNSKMRDYLPEAFSDYIFAIIFEEWGPLGALLVLALYLGLLLRCYKLSKRTDDPYLRLLIVGLPLIMVIQALIHIGVCTGAMFVTGQPLPLISRGGSSILATSASLGMILALSRIIRQEQEERPLAPILHLPITDTHTSPNSEYNEISD